MGLEKDEYPLFKELNRNVIKPAIMEINELTNFCVEIETKRIGRKIGELKFRISRLKEIPTLEPTQEAAESTQASLFVDMEDLPALAVKLVQAGVSQKEALRIANEEWDGVDAAAVLEDKEDFAVYVDEKIGLARHATNVRNAGGFIVKAIRENYQDPEFQKQLQAEKKKEKQEILALLRREMLEKRHALIRQAVRANPELIEQAAEKITSSFVREVLMGYDSVKDAYAAGVLVAGEINSILAKEFCADLIAPIIAAYEAEKERLEG
jgi:plasmid replication initiation protein